MTNHHFPFHHLVFHLQSPHGALVSLKACHWLSAANLSLGLYCRKLFLVSCPDAHAQERLNTFSVQFNSPERFLSFTYNKFELCCSTLWWWRTWHGVANVWVYFCKNSWAINEKKHLVLETCWFWYIIWETRIEKISEKKTKTNINVIIISQNVFMSLHLLLFKTS